MAFQVRKRKYSFRNIRNFESKHQKLCMWKRENVCNVDLFGIFPWTIVYNSFCQEKLHMAWLPSVLTFSFSFNVLNGVVTHPTRFFHLFVLSHILFICLFACSFIQSVIYSALYFYLLIYVSFIFLFIQLLSCL